MNPSACASQTTPVANATGAPTKTLTDNRDGNTYTIAKLKDGKCWMTQNIRIVGKTLTPNDSDVTTSFALSTSSISGFSNDSNQSRVYYANNTTNGAYYSWYTATAGTGDASFTSGDAPSSICPSGWKLPSGNSYASGGLEY